MTIYGVPALFTAQRREAIQPEESCQPVSTHSVKTCQLEICKQIQKFVEIHNTASILRSIEWVLLILFFFFLTFQKLLFYPQTNEWYRELKSSLAGAPVCALTWWDPLSRLISSDLLSIPTAPPLASFPPTLDRKSSQNLIQWDFPDLVFLDLQEWWVQLAKQLVETGPRDSTGVFPHRLTPR